jgi:hypothetical protein
VTAGCPGLRPEPRCDRRAAADSTANRRSGCAPASRSSAPASPALARAARLASVCADSRARLPRSCDITRSEAAPARRHRASLRHRRREPGRRSPLERGRSPGRRVLGSCARGPAPPGCRARSQHSPERDGPDGGGRGGRGLPRCSARDAAAATGGHRLRPDRLTGVSRRCSAQAGTCRSHGSRSGPGLEAAALRACREAGSEAAGEYHSRYLRKQHRAGCARPVLQ